MLVYQNGIILDLWSVCILCYGDVVLDSIWQLTVSEWVVWYIFINIYIHTFVCILILYIFISLSFLSLVMCWKMLDDLW